MRIVFADTSYWVAILDQRDELHSRAGDLSRKLNPVHIVTSQMVLTELLNYFAERGSYLRHATVGLTEQLNQNANVTVVPQSIEQFQSALLLYRQREDQGWSLTDCSSFQIMQEWHLTEALTYDKHFEQAGFKALLRNE